MCSACPAAPVAGLEHGGGAGCGSGHGLAFLHFREPPHPAAALVRFQISAPGSGSFNLSPDGRKLLFIAGGRLWVHSLESGESRDVTAAEGGVPFWSADSRFIGYLSEGKLRRIAATGGLPQTVAIPDAGFLWGDGAWNQDDVIVFGDRHVGFFRVPATGGVPVQITAVDRLHHKSQYRPRFLPDGRHFVFICDSAGKGKSAIYVGSVDAKPEEQSSKPLVASDSGPAYVSSASPGSGYLLFVREGTLMAQPFDNRRLEVKGQAMPVAERIRGGHGTFSASANDVQAFRQLAASELTWYDREGKVMVTAGSISAVQARPGALAGWDAAGRDRVQALAHTTSRWSICPVAPRVQGSRLMGLFVFQSGLVARWKPNHL